MKDVLVGIAAAITAGAAFFALLFDQLFTDTTELQKSLVDDGVDTADAKTIAQERRRKQKLYTLGLALFVAFGLSVGALFVSKGKNDSGPKPHAVDQRKRVASIGALR